MFFVNLRGTLVKVQLLLICSILEQLSLTATQVIMEISSLPGESVWGFPPILFLTLFVFCFCHPGAPRSLFLCLCDRGQSQGAFQVKSLYSMSEIECCEKERSGKEKGLKLSLQPFVERHSLRLFFPSSKETVREADIFNWLFVS